MAFALVFRKKSDLEYFFTCYVKSDTREAAYTKQRCEMGLDRGDSSAVSVVYVDPDPPDHPLVFTYGSQWVSLERANKWWTPCRPGTEDNVVDFSAPSSVFVPKFRNLMVFINNHQSGNPPKPKANKLSPIFSIPLPLP